LVPTYFVGLPLLLAGAHLLVGWHLASFIVIFGSAILLLVSSYLMLRTLQIDGRLAIAAVVGLAWCPIFVFASSQTYSDVVASLGCALAALCVLKSSKANVVFALVAGASLGFVLLVRSTDCLLLPCLLILSPSWRHRIAIGVGCLPFVAAVIGYQHLVYGSALTSGYGDIFRFFTERCG
jgi:4-amino-4-deoxy-L-arabinose transferase-like glycosyltransferase